MTTKGMCRRLKAALIVFAIAMAHSSVTTGQERRPGDLRVAGPYNHKNLSIFLIGDDFTGAIINLITALITTLAMLIFITVGGKTSPSRTRIGPLQSVGATS